MKNDLRVLFTNFKNRKLKTIGNKSLLKYTEYGASLFWKTDSKTLNVKGLNF